MNSFFDELVAATSLLPNYDRVYRMLNNIFQRLLYDKTKVCKLNLAGTFAKTDYLLKENNAPKALAQATNLTRTRLRKYNEMSKEKLEHSFPFDLRNIAQFVAFLFKTDIPDSLQCLLPKGNEKYTGQNIITDCIRVIVNSWDDDYIYCDGENNLNDNEEALSGSPKGGVVDKRSIQPLSGGEIDNVSIQFPLRGVGGLKICYTAMTKPYDFDWTYLRKILRVNSQLNIICPREKDGILYPELIIFEPDYLIDISAIAKCFTNYAESPFVNVIERLKPAQNTEAIVLGNFAGQLLDEQIHQLPESHTYYDSVTDFWRENAINLLTAGISQDFHTEAQMQKQNIAHAIDETLPESIAHFNSKEGMVEPSFYSQMLGLQGRMDYLQLDFKVLLEQKSGKGNYPYDDFSIPRYKEEHYVQLLLYMALIRYNYKDVYEKNNRELHSFLLYSKYKESLLGLGFAPQLLCRALKIRNTLVWTDFLFADNEGVKILGTLTPEKLNMKKVNNNLWQRFQRKQIADVLAPIQMASELEKAYYYRFISFISNEHILSKLGNKTKENSGFASTWNDTLAEKLEAGNIYDNLTLIKPDEETTGRVKTVELMFKEDEGNNMSNFRVGDIVILYSYEEGKEPNACANMVFRCTIESIEADTILLTLRASQSDARVFMKDKEKRWAIEHDFMESSYSSLYKGMHAFLSAPKERKDLLLFQREAQYSTSKALKGNYGSFNNLAAKAKNAEDLFLIIGPPGTGKTSFGMLNTLKEELLEENTSVLLLSFTNRAVDEICSKLYEEGIDFLRIGGEQNCAPEYRDKLLSQRALNCKNLNELKNVITSARVVVATTTKMNSSVALFNLKTFSLAIIDEASQILEPHLIGLLSAHNDGVPAIKKFVMIGDHKQLPAVVQQTQDVSKVNEKSLNDILLTDCRLSLFERLLKKYENNEHITYMLRNQGRMHQDIALFPNVAFYNNMLDVVPLPHQIAELPTAIDSDDSIMAMLQTKRIAFIDAELPDFTVSYKVNQVEADIICDIVKHIYELEKEAFEPYETVGVIVPYRNQIATIRNTISKLGIKELHDITIDTVERYQGSQRKYIIYGFTIQRSFQLDFLTDNTFVDSQGNVIDRKLNVAMTRAKEHLIMVGNSRILSQNPIFKRMIDFIG